MSLFFQVSLLLKDSFIDSFPSRDRSFIKVSLTLIRLAASILHIYLFIRIKEADAR